MLQAAFQQSLLPASCCVLDIRYQLLAACSSAVRAQWLFSTGVVTRYLPGC
jgi:hypothetical protein